MKVWYLAHPVTEDNFNTLKDNMDSILEYLKAFHEAGIHAQAPYYANLLVLDNDDIVNYNDGLLANISVLRRGYDGLILCGHKMSRGMVAELEHFQGPILNVVGLTVGDIYGLEFVVPG